MELYTCTKEIDYVVDTNQKKIETCKTTLNNTSNHFRKLSRIFSVTGNEMRLKILYLLNVEKELTTTDLAEILGVITPVVSQHICKIKSSGILNIRREGHFLYYSLNKDKSAIFSSLFNSFEF